jgi:multidrug efflux system membrane fusion protein
VLGIDQSAAAARHRPPPWVAATAALALLAACSQQPPAVSDARPVRVMTLASAALTSAAELPGEIRPRLESQIGFQVGGRIVERRVEVGHSVKAGDVLATLDGRDYRLAAAAAGEALVAARTDRDQQRADYKRFEDLRAQGFISTAELERRKSALDAAEARYNQAAAQAEVNGNQAGYAVLKAPNAGVVTAVDAEAGQVVAAGQSIVRLAPALDKEVAVAIPESRLAELRRAPAVRVTLWAGGPELRGHIREIAPVADAATRTFAARIALAQVPPEVAFGMSATVKFDAPARGSALRLPLQALLREGGATYVWKLNPSALTVQRVPVRVLALDGNELAIADGGVHAGDTLVTAGVHLLQDGQEVRPLATAAATAATVAGRP